MSRSSHTSGLPSGFVEPSTAEIEDGSPLSSKAQLPPKPPRRRKKGEVPFGTLPPTILEVALSEDRRFALTHDLIDQDHSEVVPPEDYGIESIHGLLGQQQAEVAQTDDFRRVMLARNSQ